MPPLPTYTRFGGCHPETAALANTLAASGVRSPHTGQPYSEAMLLGLGGGLGAGYILWEFNEHKVKILVVAWSANWQYPRRFMRTAWQRLNVGAAERETGSRATALKALQAALDAGTPPVAWVDRAHLPYLQLPEQLKGHLGHLVAVAGVEPDGTVLVDDLATAPFRVPAAAFAEARARITSYKNRLLIPQPGDTAAVDLPAAIRAGLSDCATNLEAKSDSFSLPAIAKWAKMVTDKKNKKGWPNLFPTPKGLYALLKSVFEGVELADNGGGALRGLYADFLDEAAPLVERPALAEVAGRYRALAAQWSALAEAALPDRVPGFKETKAVLRRKHTRLLAAGSAAEAEVWPLTRQLEALYGQLNPAFPLDAAEIAALWAELGERLHALYAAEREAAGALRQAIS